MSDEPQGPFWHEHNPWKDRVIYVTEAEWLDCLVYQRRSYARRMARLPFHDLYILPSPDGLHSMGMRYGRRGPEYLSPYGDLEKMQKLIDKHRGGQDGA